MLRAFIAMYTCPSLHINPVLCLIFSIQVSLALNKAEIPWNKLLSSHFQSLDSSQRGKLICKSMQLDLSASLYSGISGNRIKWSLRCLQKQPMCFIWVDAIYTALITDRNTFTWLVISNEVVMVLCPPPVLWNKSYGSSFASFVNKSLWCSLTRFITSFILFRNAEMHSSYSYTVYISLYCFPFLLNLFPIQVDLCFIIYPSFFPSGSRHDKRSKSALLWYYVSPNSLYVRPISGEANMQWNKAVLCSALHNTVDKADSVSCTAATICCELLKRTQDNTRKCFRL